MIESEAERIVAGVIADTVEQRDRYAAAIARVATLETRDVDADSQIQAAINRGDPADVLFYAGVARGIEAAKEALRERRSG
jgi:hypothetical protein